MIVHQQFPSFYFSFFSLLFFKLFLVFHFKRFIIKYSVQITIPRPKQPNKRLQAMSGSFKVEKLSQQTNPFAKTQKLKPQQNQSKKPSNEVTLSIPSIPILKYSSIALVEILASFFQNTETLPSYHQVQKALKIISLLTQQDESLRSDIQNLILNNIHKKTDVYVFFCLWAQYLDIVDIVGRFFSKKTQQKIIYTILYVYIGGFGAGVTWYQGLAMRWQVGRLLNVQLLSSSKVIQEVDAEITYLKLTSYNHFQSIILKLISVITLSASTKILLSFQKMLVNFIKNPKVSSFLDEAVGEFISNQQNQKNHLLKSLLELISQNNLREANDVIQRSIHKGLNDKFNSENKQTFYSFIETAFLSQSKQKISQSYLIKALKDWFTSVEQSILWSLFNENFSFKLSDFSQNKRKEIIQKRALMFSVFFELSKQNQKTQKQVQRIIYCQYIYHFFEGKPFDFTIQSRFLQSHAQGKFQGERQAIMKAIKQIKNHKFLNLMIFNKATFPSVIDWQVDPSFTSLLNKHSSSTPIKKLLNQINSHWQKIESQLLIENKKIELLFSVIRVSIDNVIVLVTFQQLIELIKAVNEIKGLNFAEIGTCKYREAYGPIAKKEDINTNKSLLMGKDQQIHPIIMQAKIVKLLKKSLKKATAQQIAKSLNFDKQKTYQSCKKLVSKGLLEQNADETYSYEP